MILTHEQDVTEKLFNHLHIWKIQDMKGCLLVYF